MNFSEPLRVGGAVFRNVCLDKGRSVGWWLLFAVFLFVACAALIVAEVFIPSGGVLSICALACVAGGVAIFFRYSVVAGWVGVVVAMVMVPTLLVSRGSKLSFW